MAQGQEIHNLGTHSTSIEDYYEEWGPQKYEACLKEWGYTAPERVTKLIRKYGPAPSEAKLLDAGVGTGLLITPLKDAGYIDATGIDIWQGGLDKAKERDFYKALGKADLQEPLPRSTCPDGVFDVVVSVGVLTYINPETCCLREFLRVLKPGGIVCYTNRTDKLDQWAASEQKLIDEKSWELVERSERIPYLPFNKEFGKDTEIVISVWRKTPEVAVNDMQGKEDALERQYKLDLWRTMHGLACKEDIKATEEMLSKDRTPLSPLNNRTTLDQRFV
eukprot:gnl/MRDRNA2_/MRDRNA2_92020_c1_seq1.p1 gnl/MRDRNA2_/MRDRNA2_92020_c1~~gnl/MRDRNA2_/MRDRNA2_92020_c1_seq1.p1  ORF type:complete len:277 (-),score=68.65 gnl/MRDRNA2_/MRDRNA2_92020_c1_seq1:536-1366(-)